MKSYRMVPTVSPLQFQFSAMTTRCEIQCYGLNSRRFQVLADQIVAQVTRLVKQYNFHDENSWLNRRINNRTTPEVSIDPECARVLGIVRQHSIQVDGVFDITAGTYAKRLQHVASLSEALQIKMALVAYTGLDRWQLDGPRLVFDNPHTQFDLGGVIKEYAVDFCLRLACDAGASAALVNFGGDVNCFGVKPDGQRFVAAVKNPNTPDSMLFGLDLHNQALTTSGHYARKRCLPDGSLSHVLCHPENSTDRNKSQNTNLQWSSATAVSGSTLVSGIYSTSLLLNPDLKLPENVFAYTVDHAGKVHQLPQP